MAYKMVIMQALFVAKKDEGRIKECFSKQSEKGKASRKRYERGLATKIRKLRDLFMVLAFVKHNIDNRFMYLEHVLFIIVRNDIFIFHSYFLKTLFF